MTPGPYHPGKNVVSASRLNETDALSRKPLRVGPGLTMKDTGLYRLISLVPQKQQPVAAGVSGAVRYALGVEITPNRPDDVMVQLLKSARQVFPDTEPPSERIVWTFDGSPRVAIVPPNFKAVDFEKFLRPDRTTLGRNDPVLRLDRHGEDWIVSLQPRWAARDIPQGASVVRCT